MKGKGLEGGKRGSVRLNKMDRFYLELVVEEDEDAMNDPSTIFNWTPDDQEEHTQFRERTKGKTVKKEEFCEWVFYLLFHTLLERNRVIGVVFIFFSVVIFEFLGNVGCI